MVVERVELLYRSVHLNKYDFSSTEIDIFQDSTPMKTLLKYNIL